jgi:hypothetical protein
MGQTIREGMGAASLASSFERLQEKSELKFLQAGNGNGNVPQTRDLYPILEMEN